MTQTDKYFGLLMASGKSKVPTFKDLQVKITKRVMGVEREVLKQRAQENKEY